MKDRLITTIFMLCLCMASLSAQVYPADQPQDTTISGSEYVPWQLKSGGNYTTYRLPFPYVKRYMSPNVVTSAIAFDPTTATSGQKYNYLGKFVTYTTNSHVYYIDGQGLVIDLGDPAGGGGGGSVSSVFGRTGGVTASSGDYNAGQITNTPSGTISGNTVQLALNELDTEKLADATDAVDADNLAANSCGPSELASTAVTAGTYGNSTNFPIFTVDGDGRITAASNQSFTGLTDGDKGDITVGSSGAAFTVDNSTITSAKIVDGTIALGDLAFTPLTSEVDGSTSNELTTFTSASSAPGSPKVGDIWHDSDGDSVFIRTSAPSWAFLAIRAGSGGGSGDDVSAFPNATNITSGEKIVLTNPDSLVTFQQIANQVVDSVGVGEYMKKIYARTSGGNFDYQLGPMSVLTNDTIWTAFRSSPDHNVTGNISYGCKLAAFSAHSGQLLFEEWVVMDSLNSPSNNNGSVNNISVYDLGSGKRIFFWVKVTQEGTPTVTPRIKEVFWRIRNADGTYGTIKRVSGGYVPETNSGWQSTGNFFVGAGGAWYLSVYGGSHPSNPTLNRQNYDILLLRSVNQGNTWTTYKKIADGVLLSRQFEEPYVFQTISKDANGQIVKGKWACTIRIDGGGGSLNSINWITTSAATDTLNWTTALTNNRPIEKFAGAGYPFPFVFRSSPGKIAVLTRNRVDGNFGTVARDWESVYYITENNGETWAGPFTLDKRKRASTEKFMYGSMLDFLGDVVVVWAQERNGDSGQSDIYMKKIPHQLMGGDVVSKELEISRFLPPSTASESFYPNLSSFNLVNGSGAMGSTPKTTTTTSGNFVFGINALKRADGALDNFVALDSAGQNCTTCRENIIIGSGTKMNIAGFTGFYNTVLNSGAAASLKTGYDNFVAGRAAMSIDTSSSDVVSIGRSTFPSLLRGNDNIAIGLDAGAGLISGTRTRFVGRTPSFGDVSDFIAFGVGSTIGDVGYAWLKGSYRLLLGGAGNTSMTSSYIFAAGREALLSNTSGNFQIAIGGRALRATTTGTNNIGLSQTNTTNRGAGESNTTGSYNVYIQEGAGSKNNGSNNNMIGWFAGNNCTGCDNTTIVGNDTGLGLTDADNCTIVGRYSGLPNEAGQVILANGVGTTPSFYAKSNGTAVIHGGNADFDASAALKINSSTLGFLPPKLTTTARNAIPSPTNGLSLYDDTANRPTHRVAGAWQQTAFLAEVALKGGNTDAASVTLGSNDSNPLNLETNNTTRLQLGATGRITTGTATDFIGSFSDSLKLTAATFDIDATTKLANRLQTKKAADVASAGTITLGAGNVFHITGTTTINEIVDTGWQLGSIVTLVFDGALTLTHNATSTGAVPLFLSGSANQSIAANATRVFVYDGSYWRQVGGENP